jgi:ferritin-like metal-binding protein YciE
VNLSDPVIVVVEAGNKNLRRWTVQQSELKELFIDELKDSYSDETQLVKALPKMAKAAESEELRSGFQEHLEQTKGHVSRLEEIFADLEEKPTGKKCMGMEGLIKEGGEAAEEDYEGDAKDAALIGAAQRVEHYEIAAYGTVRAMAEKLGEERYVELLSETLQEEKDTDEKLTELAEAMPVEESGEEDAKASESETKAPKRKAARA